MLNIEIDTAQIRSALVQAKTLLSDMTPVYAEIGEYMIGATRDRFIKGVDPTGKAWAPKSQATLERYKRLGYGSLTRPLIGPGRALSRQIQKIVSSDGVVIGSSLAYSRVMQEGAARGAFGTDSRGRAIPWGRIPARVWLGLSDADGRAIVEIIEENLGEALGDGGPQTR